MTKTTPTNSLEDLSNVLAKLDVHEEQVHHEESSIAAFFKKILSLGSKGEDMSAVGAAAPVTMLEPLSQLEMVSRWNVDTFLKITNEKSDLERMKAVAAFALAGLPVLCHDGKKPINPIITEVMTCAYVNSADAKCQRSLESKSRTIHRSLHLDFIQKKIKWLWIRSWTSSSLWEATVFIRCVEVQRQRSFPNRHQFHT